MLRLTTQGAGQLEKRQIWRLAKASHRSNDSSYAHFPLAALYDLACHPLNRSTAVTHQTAISNLSGIYFNGIDFAVSVRREIPSPTLDAKGRSGFAGRVLKSGCSARAGTDAMSAATKPNIS